MGNDVLEIVTCTACAFCSGLCEKGDSGYDSDDCCDCLDDEVECCCYSFRRRDGPCTPPSSGACLFWVMALGALVLQMMPGFVLWTNPQIPPTSLLVFDRVEESVADSVDNTTLSQVGIATVGDCKAIDCSTLITLTKISATMTLIGYGCMGILVLVYRSPFGEGIMSLLACGPFAVMVIFGIVEFCYGFIVSYRARHIQEALEQSDFWSQTTYYSAQAGSVLSVSLLLLAGIITVMISTFDCSGGCFSRQTPIVDEVDEASGTGHDGGYSLDCNGYDAAIEKNAAPMPQTTSRGDGLCRQMSYV